MLNTVHALKDWIVGFADSPWAVLVLAVNAFTESIFNPVPSDPLIFAIAAINPEVVFFLAAVATLASVAGAVVGWALGFWFGRPVLQKVISSKKEQQVESLFARYGVWLVLIAAFTPIPYKVVAITAGVLKFGVGVFIAVSLVGRGARFFLLAGVIHFIDATDTMEAVTNNLTTLTVWGVVGAMPLVAVAVLGRRMLRKWL